VVIADLALVAMTDRADTVAALALGNSVGMTVAGALLLAALARDAGRAALAGLLRVGLVGAVAALLGLLVGRLITDLVSGPALVPNIGVAAAGTAATAVAFAAIVLVGAPETSRGIVRAVRRG
jgi:putative peptidoglycan lipid II flippase